MPIKDIREYRPLLEAAIQHEEAHAKDGTYIGWEWHDVRAYPATLMKLVIEGVIKVNFKSNSTTAYLLTDRSRTKTTLAAR